MVTWGRCNQSFRDQDQCFWSLGSWRSSLYSTYLTPNLSHQLFIAFTFCSYIINARLYFRFPSYSFIISSSVGVITEHSRPDPIVVHLLCIQSYQPIHHDSFVFCAALNSSIFFTRFLNSSYWHFSYEWRSCCWLHVSITQCKKSSATVITSHFQGRYHSSLRHLFNGMRRWAHESRYARGRRASDIWAAVAAVHAREWLAFVSRWWRLRDNWG